MLQPTELLNWNFFLFHQLLICDEKKGALHNTLINYLITFY